MKTLIAVGLLLLSLVSNAQVNAYARVTSISSNSLTVSVPNETYASFAAGSMVIVMQMQDDVIGSNTSNNSSFGNLSTIASAGDFEAAVVSSVTRSGGVVTQITLNSPLSKTFSTGNNSMLQVISYPVLGTNGFTTTSDITAVPWNGFTGGVVAFRVQGTLTLAHHITANAAGFLGGTTNAGNAGSCDAGTYRTAVGENFANKGEGIYRATNSAYAAGRARILNGGGGANSHNGGGGGGGNITSGGEGGQGYGCSASAGGMGGINLSTFISSQRVFMGGGGGAGEANNSFNTSGGQGGGIIIISAHQIVTTGTGTARTISANGQTAGDVGNDGAGGGGAGGSVILNVATWNIASTKTLTISANGGNGGNVGDPAAHGGGAGGGQGAVIFTSAIPVTNISTNTLNGNGGRNYTGGTFAGNGSGSNNTGIYSQSFAILPVKILSFKAYGKPDRRTVEWEVANEQDMNYYEIQRSTDGETFQTIGRRNVKSNGSRSVYTFEDDAAADGHLYYRLLMVEYNGNNQTSPVFLYRGKLFNTFAVSVHPNPAREQVTLKILSSINTEAIMRIYNVAGMLVMSKRVPVLNGENRVPVQLDKRLKGGIYQVTIVSGKQVVSTRMTIVN